jgi:anaerobic magnesium-protoporphyrin IX monomethyl ester cyclase
VRVLLIIYDNGSLIHYFPVGMAYIASVLRKEHEVVIYNQDLNHWPESHLTDYLNKNHFDAVCLGFVGNHYTYNKVIKIAEAIRASNASPHFVLGGHGPSADPQFFLNKLGADAVVVGEGETSVKVAIQQTGVFRSPPLEIDDIPWPAYDLFPINYYRLLPQPHSTNTDFVMPLISARGCIFKCNFCYRMDEGYRMRAVEDVVEEIQYLQKNYGITYIDFEDELTMSSVKRMTALSEEILPLKIKWACNGRLNFAKPDLLKLMKRAGCVFINYGIEAMDDAVLEKMHKHLNVGQIIKGIEATLNADISPGFNIIFGHKGDTKETLERGVEFLLKYDDGAQRRTISPVTPYPGSELYYDAIREGKLKDCHDFYAKHLNPDLLTVNFTEMTEDEFHRVLLDANTKLLQNYYTAQMDSIIGQAKDLYLNKNTNFRGYRA